MSDLPGWRFFDTDGNEIPPEDIIIGPAYGCRMDDTGRWFVTDPGEDERPATVEEALKFTMAVGPAIIETLLPERASQ